MNADRFFTGSVGTVFSAFLAILLIAALFRLRHLHLALMRKSRALEKSEQHIQMMGDNLPNVATFQVVIHQEGSIRITYLSKGFEHILGFDCEPIIANARIAFDQVYEADIPMLEEILQQSANSLDPADFEIRVLDVSGKLKWLHVSAAPHRETNVLIWDGFLQDVSQTKRFGDALLEENRNFQNFFETIDDFMIVCDMNGKLLHTNPSVERKLAYSADELIRMNIFELYPEHMRNEIYKIIACMQSEKSTTCGLPLQAHDGMEIPVEMNIFQGSWQNQKAIFGVARDITGRQRTEDALRESQNMLQLIMDAIPMSVCWKNKDSVYLGCNKTFVRECFLDNADDVIGNTPFDLFEASVASDVIERDRQIIEYGHPIFNLLRSHTLPNGSIGWREISGIPLHNETERIVGVLDVWNDVTEQHRSKEQLKRTLEDMERFNQLMRDRERRTLELKAEINNLLAELGKSKKYKTTTDDL